MVAAILTLFVYVLTQPPVYAGPPRPPGVPSPVPEGPAPMRKFIPEIEIGRAHV